MLLILAWLVAHSMHVRLGDPTVGGVRDFAVYEEFGHLTFDTGLLPGGGCRGNTTPPFVNVRALVVPQVMASEATLQATAVQPGSVPPVGYFIPRQSNNQGLGYYSIGLPNGQRPQGVTVILTPLFTGCAFAIAVANGQVHMAHIQPRSAAAGVYDPMADRGSLSQLLRDRGGLSGLALRRTNFFTFGGDRLANGYGFGEAQLIGLVFDNTIMFLIKFWDLAGVPRTLILDARDLA